MAITDIHGKSTSFLAIIPARAGSKRVPGKNTRPLGDKPLVSWTIDAAMQSRFIDRIVVSSDDEAVLRLASAAGEKVVALARPTELATDTTPTPQVILHALDAQPQRYDGIILLQPTTPFRTAEHIDAAIERYAQKHADGIISVSKPAQSPLWCNVLPDDGDMSHFLDRSLLTTRSQDLPVYHALNGAIFIANTEKFRQNGNFFLPERVFAYEMPERASVDIDTEEDFAYAKFLLTQQGITS